MKTKKIEITLTATTCLQYVEVVEVPADISNEEVQRLVNDRYETINAEEFSPVGDSWERGDCGALDASPKAEATVKAVRVAGGILAQELSDSNVDGLHYGKLEGRVVSEEDELDFEPFLFGRLEVPFRTSENSGLPEKAVVDDACSQAITLLRALNAGKEGVKVFPLNRDLREGHSVITVAVPIYPFDHGDSAQLRLADAIKGCEDIDTLFSVVK